MKDFRCLSYDIGGVFSRFYIKLGSVLIFVIIWLIVNEVYYCDLSVLCNCIVKYGFLEVVYDGIVCYL